MISEKKITDCVRAIEARLEEEEMNNQLNTPLREGDKKALEILQGRISDLEEAKIEELQTTQSRAIALLAIDFLNGTCEKDAFVRSFDDSTVNACGHAIVWGNEKSIIQAWGNANIDARDQVKLEAWDDAYVSVLEDTVEVEAGGDCIVKSHGNISCELKGNAIHRVVKSNTLRVPSSAKIEVNNPEE